MAVIVLVTTEAQAVLVLMASMERIAKVGYEFHCRLFVIVLFVAACMVSKLSRVSTRFQTRTIEYRIVLFFSTLYIKIKEILLAVKRHS